MKIQRFFRKKHFTKKRIIWGAIILIIFAGGVYFIFRGKNNSASIQTGFVLKQNLQQTVLSTGQVVSGTDLSLGFQGISIKSEQN